MITSAANERVQEVSVTDDELVVAFIDGRTLSVPLVWYPRLLHASPEQRNDWRLIGDGEGVHWPQIDEDLSAAGLLHGFSDPAVRKAGPPDASDPEEDLSVKRNEAAQRFAETLADSYRLVYGQAAESAERQQPRAREFSELVSRDLREQSEAGRAGAEQLSEQTARQQQADQRLVRESVEAYAEFLNEAFSRYHSGTERAMERAPEGARTVTETTIGLVSTSAFPIASYDEMNVEEASKRLNDLSVEELRLVRDYEERNKNRETLLEQMDRKIRAS